MALAPAAPAPPVSLSGILDKRTRRPGRSPACSPPSPAPGGRDPSHPSAKAPSPVGSAAMAAATARSGRIFLTADPGRQAQPIASRICWSVRAIIHSFALAYSRTSAITCSSEVPCLTRYADGPPVAFTATSATGAGDLAAGLRIGLRDMVGRPPAPVAVACMMRALVVWALRSAAVVICPPVAVILCNFILCRNLHITSQSTFIRINSARPQLTYRDLGSVAEAVALGFALAGALARHA